MAEISVLNFESRDSIYIIQGESGECDYYNSWIVCGFIELGDAIEHKGKLDDFLDKNNVVKDKEHYVPYMRRSLEEVNTTLRNPYDPNMRRCDGYGVEYYIREIELK